MIVAIVGPRGAGKTTAAARVAAAAGSQGKRVAGILAPAVSEAGRRVGYDVLDLATGQRDSWLRRTDGKGGVGPFCVVERGRRLAARALERLLRSPCFLGVIDEVGEWELRGGGHARVLDALHVCAARHVVLVVREGLVCRVARRWGLPVCAFGVGGVAVLLEELGLRPREALDGGSAPLEEALAPLWRGGRVSA